jgi:GABA permease
VQDTPVGRRAHADQATAQAQYRLGQLLGDLRRMGVDADGELGDADPLKAVGEVLKHRQVDEIVLSTLPKPVSRWLAVDLPHRLQRRFGLPVTTVTTKR